MSQDAQLDASVTLQALNLALQPRLLHAGAVSGCTTLQCVLRSLSLLTRREVHGRKLRRVANCSKALLKVAWWSDSNQRTHLASGEEACDIYHFRKVLWEQLGFVDTLQPCRGTCRRYGPITSSEHCSKSGNPVSR